MDIGEKHGRWMVVAQAPKRQYWLCRCDCGTVRVVYGPNISRGLSKSCGCLKREITSRTKRTHGMRQTPEYRVWYHMRQRCQNPRDDKFPDYGGRGITVAPAWEDFAVFLADVGQRPSTYHQLDRIDNNGPYAPSNVRWALPVVQANNRRNTQVYTVGDTTRTLAEWADAVGLHYLTLYQRLHVLHWSIEKAIATPHLGSRRAVGPRRVRSVKV